jgi:hypothetical protein
MKPSGVPPARSVNYREKARELREMATSAPSKTLRDQLMRLARQYEQLAVSVERDNSD